MEIKCSKIRSSFSEDNLIESSGTILISVDSEKKYKAVLSIKYLDSSNQIIEKSHIVNERFLPT